MERMRTKVKPNNMNNIILSYRIESSEKTTKISAIEGELTHGIKKDKEGNEVLTEPKTISQAVNFLLTLLRTIDVSQFKGKFILKVNGIKVSEKMLKAKPWEWNSLFPKEAAVICATLAAMDSSLTQQWGKECNIYGNENAVFDEADISAMSVEVIKKANFLTTLRKTDAVSRVWSEKELQLQDSYKELRKLENKAKKEAKALKA